MESLVKMIDQELKALNKEMTKLQRARTALVDEPIIPKTAKGRKTEKLIKHRSPTGELKMAILATLSDNGSLSNNEIVEKMKRNGYKFANRSVTSRASTVRSCLARMVKAKGVGKISIKDGVVFTTKAETFQPDRKMPKRVTA